MSTKTFSLIKSLQAWLSKLSNLRPSVLLGIVLLLTLALRVYDLGAESYWIDEMSTVIESQQSDIEILTSGRFDQPPAFYLPFNLWVQIFGTSEAYTRLFSSLLGFGCVVVLYFIGRELFGEKVGILGAFLMAISGFQIYYSQIARYYSFFEFMTLCSYLFFIIFLRSKKVVHLIFYILTSIFMLFSHTFGVFILFAQDLFLILQWRKFKNLAIPWLIGQALIILAYGPYLYNLVFASSGFENTVNLNIGETLAPPLIEPLRSIYHFFLPARGARSRFYMLATYAIAGAFLFLVTWIHNSLQKRNILAESYRGFASALKNLKSFDRNYLLLFCWLLCPILLPFIISLAFIPIYNERYTINASPALYLLLSAVIYRIRKTVPLTAILGALLIVIIPNLYVYYATDVNEQWKEVASYVTENSNPDEMIVFAPNNGIGIQQKTFNWYYHGNLQGCGIKGTLVDPGEISEALSQCISGRKRFWVIIRDKPSVTESVDRFTTFFQHPDQMSMQLINFHQFIGISVYLFELQK